MSKHWELTGLLVLMLAKIITTYFQLCGRIPKGTSVATVGSQTTPATSRPCMFTQPCRKAFTEIVSNRTIQSESMCDTLVLTWHAIIGWSCLGPSQEKLSDSERKFYMINSSRNVILFQKFLFSMINAYRRFLRYDLSLNVQLFSLSITISITVFEREWMLGFFSFSENSCYWAFKEDFLRKLLDSLTCR